MYGYFFLKKRFTQNGHCGPAKLSAVTETFPMSEAAQVYPSNFFDFQERNVTF